MYRLRIATIALIILVSTSTYGQFAGSGLPQAVVSPDTLKATLSQCNDSVVVPISITNTGTGALLYNLAFGEGLTDNFEHGPGQWTLEGDWGFSTNSYSGNYSLATNPNGPYGDDLFNAAYLSNPIKVIDASVAEISFRIFSDLYCCDGIIASSSYCDYMYAQISVNGGEFQEIYSAYCQTNEWDKEILDLSGYVSNGDLFVFRFLFSTDNYGQADGIFIDEFEITGASPISTGIKVSNTNGMLAAGASTTIPVTFLSEGLITGTYSGILPIQTSDTALPFFNVFYEFTLNGYPVIASSVSSLDFGILMKNASRTDTLYIENIGCDTLRLTDLNVSDARFTAVFAATFVMPGTAYALPVRFQPDNIGLFSAILSVESNAGALSFSLSGEGSAAPHLEFQPPAFYGIATTCGDSLEVSLSLYNTGDTDLSLHLEPEVLPMNPSYCIPENYNYNCCNMGIHSFTLGDINNSSGNAALELNKDFTNDFSTILQLGGVYPVTIQTSAETYENVRVWIDFDNSGTFESGEIVFQSLDNSISVHEGNVSIPQNEVKQNTRLRLRVVSEYLYYPMPGPCDPVYYGQFEDYTVILKDANNPGISDTLVPGDSLHVQYYISSAGLTQGIHPINLSVISNDPLASNYSYPVSLELVGQPQMHLAPLVVNFDSAYQNVPVIRYIEIGNTGCAPLVFPNPYSTNPDIAIQFVPQQGDTARLAPGDTLRMQLTLNAFQSGNLNAIIHLPNNEKDTSILVSAFIRPSALFQINPQVSQGNLNSCNDSLAFSISLHNPGLDSLQWYAAENIAGTAINFAGTADQTILMDELGLMPEKGAFEFWFTQNYTDYYQNISMVSISGSDFNTVASGFDFRYAYDYFELFAGDTNGSYASYVISNYIAKDSWNHVAMSWDRTKDSLWIYYNGQMVQQLHHSYWTMKPVKMRVGNGMNASNAYRGKLDEMRLWEVQRTSQQITELYHSSVSPLTPGLRAYWNLNEGSGNTVSDQSPNAYDGVMAGGSWVDSGIPLEKSPSFTPLSGTIAAGDSIQLTINIRAGGLKSGNHSFFIPFQTNSIANPFLNYEFNLALDGSPALELSTDSVLFDSLMTGLQQTDTLLVYNTGCDSLFISHISFQDSIFRSNTDSLSVPPFSNAKVIVSFAPPAVGSFSDSLFVQSNAGNKTIPFRGTGLDAPRLVSVPDTLLFQSFSCDSVTSAEMQLVNTGTAPVNYQVMPFDTVFYDDFEGNADRWDASSSSWYLMPGAGYQGSDALYFYNSYSSNYNHSIELKDALQVTDSANLVITALMRYSLACSWYGYDNFIIAISRNGGPWVNMIYQSCNLSNYTFKSFPLNGYNNGDVLRIKLIVTRYGYYSSPYIYLDNFKVNGVTTVPGFSSSEPSGTLAVGDSISLNVLFNSTHMTLGLHKAYLGIETNSPLQPLIRVPVIVDFQGTPKFVTGTNSLSFDTTMARDTHSLPLQIINSGCDTLQLLFAANTSISFATDFTALSILPQDTAILTVSFHPQAEGSYYDTLLLTSNGGTQSVALYGHASLSPLLAYQPDTIVVNANCGESVTSTIQLTNSGDTTLGFLMLPCQHQGLLAYYPFQGDVNDYSGNNRHLTDAGTIPIRGIEEKDSTARQLNGYNTLAYSNETDIVDNLFKPYVSVSFWVNPSATTATEIIDLFYLSYGLKISLNTGKILATAQALDYNYFELETPAIYDQWYNVALTYDGMFFILYVNGEIADSMQTPISQIQYYIYYKKMGMGSENYYVNNSFGFDELRFYDHGLSQAEIKALYDAYSEHYLMLSALPNASTVDTGSSVISAVTFNTEYLKSGTHEGKVYVASTDPEKKFYGIPYRIQVTGSPTIVLPVSCLSLGTVFVDASKTDSLLIRNEGCGALEISAITSGNMAFMPHNSMLSIPGFDSKWLVVTFMPGSPATYQDTLTLVSNAGTHHVCLEGFAPGKPEILLSNNLIVKILACVNADGEGLLFQNQGSMPLEISVVQGENSPWLQLSGNTFTIAAGNQNNLVLTFDRTGLNSGIYSTSLNISTNDPNYPAVSVLVQLLVSNTFLLAKLGNDTAFCVNGSFHLYPGYFSSYLWNTGATSSSINVTQPGIYSVSVTDISGCFSTDTINLVQLDPPIVFSGNDTTVCTDRPFQLNAQIINALPFYGKEVILGNGKDFTAGQYGNPFGAALLNRRSSFLYDKEELEQAGLQRGHLKSVAFNLGTTDGSVLHDYTLKIGFVTPNYGNGLLGYPTELTVVFHADSLIPVTGWNTLTFDQAIFWDGEVSLAIDICYNNTNFGTDPTYQYSYSYRHVFSYNCNYCGTLCDYPYGYISNYRPNMRLGIDADINQYSWSGPGGFNANQKNPVLPNITSFSAGIYHLTINNGYGCFGSDSLMMSVNPSPVVLGGNSISMLGWDTAILAATVSQAPGPYTYQWTPADGLSRPDSATTTVSINESRTYQVEVISSNTCRDTNQVLVSVTSRYPLSGHLTYKNAFQTPMAFSSVFRKDPAQLITNTTLSDGLGDYFFPLIPVGQNFVSATSDHTPGGFNATDALLVARHITGLQYQSGVNLLATDVNASGYISAVDALLILHRTVGNISTFPLGNWVFENNSFTQQAPGSTIDLLGLAVGDVNGSFNPGAKSEPQLSLDSRDFLLLQPGVLTAVPLRVAGNMELGALTLSLAYDPDLIIVENVTSPLTGLLYKVEEGLIHLAWSDVSGMKLSAGEVMITLWVRPTLHFQGQAEVIFSQTGDCELASPDALVLPDEVLLIPRLRSGLQTTALIYLGQNQPNPFNGHTEIPFILPEAGKVRLEVLSLLGELMYPPIETDFKAGSHYLPLELSSLNAGVYLYRFTFFGSSMQQQESRMMILTR